MLSTRVIMPLALASVAFMWGCQEQTSSPTGPEGSGPLFTHQPNNPRPHGKPDDNDDPPDDPVDGTFAVSLQGIVFGGSNVDEADDIAEGVLLGPHGSKNVLQEEFHNFVPINLDEFRGLVTGGNECFRSGFPSESGMQVGQVTPSNTHDAIIRFFFDAKGPDADSDADVNYVLTVLATFDGDWPPAADNTTTITGTSFVLAHNNGPGRKVACTGEDLLVPVTNDPPTPTFTLEVTRI